MFTVQLSSHINTTCTIYLNIQKKTKKILLIFNNFCFSSSNYFLFSQSCQKKERNSDCFPASLETGAAEKQNKLLFAALRFNRNESQQSDQGKKSIIAKRVQQQKHSGDDFF